MKLKAKRWLSIKNIFCLSLLPIILSASFLNEKDKYKLQKPEIKDDGVNTVVIDAGHGGKDPGCHGSFSNEKKVCLKIALKLGALIEEYYDDVNVVYTRKTDKFIELHERAAIANRHKADLFICVHVNAAASSQAFGTETFVMGLHRTEDNLAVAKRENSSILLEDNYKRAYEGFNLSSPEASVLFSLYQNTYLKQSLNFASKVQNEFKNFADRRNRGVKQAGFLVLVYTSMPAVLIENGFLTNPSEEKFLNAESGQKKLANAIFRAFAKYKLSIEGKHYAGMSKPYKALGGIFVNGHNHEKENPTNTFFSVQISTIKEKISVEDNIWRGLAAVFVKQNGSNFKYFYGKTTSYTKAVNLLEIAKQKGFTDAYIVGFSNGKKISVTEVKQKLNKIY